MSKGKMSVIMVKTYEGLEAGKTVEVQPGYGRNFLIPSGYAIHDNPANRQMLAQRQAEIAANDQAQKDAEQRFVSRVAHMVVPIERLVQPGNNQFYQKQLRAPELIAAFQKAGIETGDIQITQINTQPTTLDIHKVSFNLGSGKTVTVNIEFFNPNAEIGRDIHEVGSAIDFGWNGYDLPSSSSTKKPVDDFRLPVFVITETGPMPWELRTPVPNDVFVVAISKLVEGFVNAGVLAATTPITANQVTDDSVFPVVFTDSETVTVDLGNNQTIKVDIRAVPDRDFVAEAIVEIYPSLAERYHSRTREVIESIRNAVQIYPPPK